MTFHVYEGADHCSGHSQPGTRNLMTAINDLWDQSTSLGLYNCRPVRGGTNLSIHSEGRAVDIGFPTIEDEHGFEYANPLGHQLLQVLLQNAWDLGLQAVIWDHRRYSRSYPTGRAYTGVNPHIDHAHLEQDRNGALTLSLNQAYELVGEMPFTQDEEEILKQIVAAIKEEDSNGYVLQFLIRMVRAAR